MNSFLKSVFGLWLIVQACLAFADVPAIERAALVALYNSTDGQSWNYSTNWLVGDPCESQWHGVECDANAMTITRLDLFQNNLTGSIPPKLGDLANLEWLHLFQNRLSGPIPAELGDLAKLEYLNLSGNQLDGPIPPELGSLVKARGIQLQNNQLSGPIPVGLSGLAVLGQLRLNDNQLSGPIPPELGSLPWLNQLYLQNNQLSGPIPPELGGLTALVYLSLSNNRLSGSIPAELGGLPLWLLSLRSNQLSGPIPPELGNAVSDKIGSIDLRWNLLSTNDAVLDAALDREQHGDWSVTQTVSELDLNIEAVGANSVILIWDLIEYTDDDGRYRVWYSRSPGGPYSDGGATPNKSVRQHLVTGLLPDTTYYFVVQTETDAHFNNRNDLAGGFSDEVSAQTTDGLTCSYVLTSPAVGEQWQRGTTQRLSWSSGGSNCGATVQLDLYRGGVLDRTIAITGNDGQYDWTIPSTQEEGNVYEVKLTDAAYGTEPYGYYFSISSNTPEPEDCSYHAVAPGAGEAWQRGTAHVIRWGIAGPCLGLVKISLLHDGFYHSIITSEAPNTGSFTWTIPASLSFSPDWSVSDQWSIRVTDSSRDWWGSESPRFQIDDEAKEFTIDYRVSGSWYGGPAEAGHGWFVEVLDADDGKQSLLVYWYVYDQGKQIWLLGTGPVIGNTAQVNAFITSGPDFPPGYHAGDLVLQPWGVLDFLFNSETTGAVSWVSTPLYGFDGAMDIQLIAPVSFGTNHCQSGSWYNTAENGHGYVSQVLNLYGGETLLLVWYVYLDGEQKWLLGTAPLMEGKASVDMQIYSAAGFPPDFDPASVVSEPWGTVQFAYTGANTASASWTTSYPGYTDGSMTLQRLTSLSGHACQ